MLEHVNLSFNNFEGEVPMIAVFTNASAFSVLGNSWLCGGLAELELPKCKETRKHKKKVSFVLNTHSDCINSFQHNMYRVCLV